jgi:sporulation protein YlmC with PRC-barrel domain
MLQSIEQLYGNKLGAADGEIGHVKDFYFDDETWAVRYVVAETGSWLTGRQVLIAPHAFGEFHQTGKLLFVNLRRAQIENSPTIELHKPVSRQFEEEYYRYYGWPSYWQGDGLWGMTGFPVVALPANIVSAPDSNTVRVRRKDAHLRSTRALKGYEIHAMNGTIGHVSDFMMDARTWAIGEFVVKIGHLLAAGEVEIPVNKIGRISYEDSAVHVNLTRNAIEQSPAHHWPPVGAEH